MSDRRLSNDRKSERRLPLPELGARKPPLLIKRRSYLCGAVLVSVLAGAVEVDVLDMLELFFLTWCFFFAGFAAVELIELPVVEVAAGVLDELAAGWSAAMAAPPTNADNAMAETITFAVRIEFSL
jgi:hypothetical protein